MAKSKKIPAAKYLLKVLPCDEGNHHLIGIPELS
jgi:hypothetical protein